MDVHLRSPSRLSFDQTDDFAVPYNAGVPDALHHDVPNHWHLSAETNDLARSTRIGAVMAVRGPNEELRVELLDHKDWLGARASGDFGAVEGWVQLRAGCPGPDGYDRAMTEGRALFRGTSSAGTPFAVGDG